MEKSMTIRTVCGYYHYTFQKGYAFGGHTHEQWEINLILAGSMNITVGENVLLASRGDFICVRPGIFHRNRLIGSSAEMVVIQFYGTGGTGRNFIASRLSDSEFAAATLAANELDRLVPENGRTPEGVDFFAAERLCEALLCFTARRENNVGRSDSRHAEIYAEAVRMMEQSVSERLTVAELARRLHVCPSVLKSAFAGMAGKGAIEYFNDLKIREAKRLLAEGKSISFVSNELGFSSQCYFSTVFRRVTGMNPKNCR